MIYFIQCGEDGPIKIGVTDSAPHARMAHFQLGCPYDLILLGATDGDGRVERQLHQRHIQDHIRGEWFKPSEAVLETVRNTLASYGLPDHRLGALPVKRPSPRGTKHLRPAFNQSVIAGPSQAISDQPARGESDAKSAHVSEHVYPDLIIVGRRQERIAEHQPQPRNSIDTAPTESAADEISVPLQSVIARTA
ncbi:GIY-YIG nuclease family protein [Mesorhizobium sp. WSM4303]|uniref:GIY-YIG nuclease family protein n=1 Tax=Mesorhizobium sp. WSM4303 TaxID=2589887 RepID=UPI00115CB59F|nr:GIY-YIG nuclease family protein [Mesorhizobium sp. WSM4303]TRD03818.1 GIY-YIG nuclease family protein [Mesorhizobium sp. WSM4303]